MYRLLLLLTCMPLAAAAAVTGAARPGGIAVLEIGAAAAAPRVRFNGMPVLTLQRHGRWFALVGLPLAQPAGDAEITIDGDTRQRLVFRVHEHRYREQHLSVAPSYVNPDPAALERIAAERARIDAVLARFTPQPLADVTLAPPLGGRRSDSFGSRRFFNDEARAPHRGMDMSGRRGEPVTAPLAGSVALRGNFYFTGHTIILDHGQGLLTLYAHLDDIAVTDGAPVDAGEVIGSVGSSGRATGPHLHFATYLNGTPVDPALLFEPGEPAP